MRKDRIESLIDLMQKNHIYQAIITSTSSIYYFLQEWIEPGERLIALFINISGKVKLITNEINRIQNLHEDYLLKYSDSENPIKILTSFIKSDEKVGIDEKWNAGFLLDLIKEINTTNLENISPLISNLRMIKDSEEIRLMKASSLINDNAMEKVIEIVSEMLPEKYLAKAIKNIFEKEGADEVSFNPIIGYGKNSSDPHHLPDNSKVKDGDPVLIDIGCIKNYYCSDMTRTVFFGKPTEKMKDIYQIVLDANLQAIEHVKPGVMASEVDSIARNFIKNKGYGDFFKHRLGHGVGLEIHEPPYISFNSKTTLKPGMIFSIEPGIYIPKIGGVRIEDLVLVTENGFEVLNKYPKDFIVI
ncbi:proline dipeptidase [Petrotoga sp. 9PW.55.5.1]|uniref:M24 family metallopeptidase n=1 Tax=Petrotoga sp. 9PW.55.5.1 TaxID=1308979 RepID=UPI000DC4CF7D|nr:Xaa-Pro peptidase family protein [Petrotoga sp. 9PW.55.5.1]RAO99705.1 proline dipeptidase [Petrotoga sp. 9PW.55.5.1]